MEDVLETMLIVELVTTGMDTLVELQDVFVIQETTGIQLIEDVDLVLYIQAVAMVITMTMDTVDVLEEVFTLIDLVEVG